MRYVRTHRVAWALSGALAAVALVAQVIDVGHGWGHIAQVALGCISAALLSYGWVVRRIASNERVLSELLKQLEWSHSETMSSHSVARAKVVSLNAAPLPRARLLRDSGERQPMIAPSRSTRGSSRLH